MLQISRRITNVLTKITLSNSRTTSQNLNLNSVCNFHTSNLLSENKSAAAENESGEKTGFEKPTAADIKRQKNDRTQAIPVETSIRYLQSAAYKQTYGEQFVWEQYRRNHKGLFPPRKTRKTCIRKGAVSTGNPCPICRDEYLVLDHRNIDLLRQFISPQTGEVLKYTKTGLCQKKHLELLVAVERAMDYGLITFDVPFREYDYSEYYGDKDINSNKKTQA